MKFFVAMEPPTVTHQQQRTVVRNGKPMRYEDPRLTDARAKLKAHLGQHAPQQPFDGALRVMVKWCFPVTPRWPHGAWRTKTPDTHNLSKLLFDVMTDLGFWTDDKIVVSEIIEKIHWQPCGLYIQIEHLPPTTQQNTNE